MWNQYQCDNKRLEKVRRSDAQQVPGNSLPCYAKAVAHPYAPAHAELFEARESYMALAEILPQTQSRHTSIPTARRIHANASSEARVSRPTLLPGPQDRWSMRVELKDDEIARLYAQGLTRGALVWRAGMPEWRPLLITPELSRLLHSTPIKLRNVNDPTLEDEVTLPRPARLPTWTTANDSLAERGNEAPTVAPSTLDVTPAAAAPAPARRRVELLGVAALGFGLAWFARGGDEPPQATAALAAPAPALAPATLPQAHPATPFTSSGGIPTVALTDLPVLSRGDALGATATSHAMARRSRTSQPARASGDGPTRAELMAALNRVASVASSCGERDGPVRVTIAFAPSGVARSIQVSGKELPSQVRSCIIGAASRARVASFSGDPVTVSKTL